MILLDESGVPQAPSNFFSLKSSASKGALGGAAIWVLLSVLLALSKNTIHNEEELQNFLNIPMCGHVPAVRTKNGAMCPLIHERSRNAGFVEAIHLLSLRIESDMEKSNKKVLLISSALPGEGKTIISVNLAINMARKGKKVLLIDCDTRNPSVAKALKVTAKQSLVDFLGGKCNIRDIICNTKVTNLHLVSGGSGGEVLTEKLSANRTG